VNAFRRSPKQCCACCQGWQLSLTVTSATRLTGCQWVGVPDINYVKQVAAKLAAKNCISSMSYPNSSILGIVCCKFQDSVNCTIKGHGRLDVHDLQRLSHDLRSVTVTSAERPAQHCGPKSDGGRTTQMDPTHLATHIEVCNCTTSVDLWLGP
jgi:hypothetical protein